MQLSDSNSTLNPAAGKGSAPAPAQSIVAEKIAQIPAILAELGIDLWMTFVRETSAIYDPALDFVYGHHVTWKSAFLMGRGGERIAIMGHHDAEGARRTGYYDEVISYHESFQPALLEVLGRLDPGSIALNYAVDHPHADGLTHGMHLLLQRYLDGTPYAGRLCSAAHIMSALRGRKSPTEIARVRAAIDTTLDIYEQTYAQVRPGRSEIEIGRFMHEQVAQRSLTTAWEHSSCPAVRSGPDSPVGHVGPTEIVIEPGHLVHFDFGVCQEEYCSDLQRVMYVLRPGESAPPEPVQRAFDAAVRSVQAAVAVMRPGVPGHVVDAAARRVITEAGYPEYKYATGHQLGRACHDGGALLGPTWERYGETPSMPLEVNQIYTVEPGLAVEGYGYIGMEEDVIVTEDGAVFLHEPQTELVLVRP